MLIIYLQHGADVNRRNRDNLTPLDMVKGHDSDIADLLRGDDALLDASKKGDLDRVKKLVTPENINCRDEHGRNSTPLHLAGTIIQAPITQYRVCKLVHLFRHTQKLFVFRQSPFTTGLHVHVPYGHPCGAIPNAILCPIIIS